jgi:hypothetical protein
VERCQARKPRGESLVAPSGVGLVAVFECVETCEGTKLGWDGEGEKGRMC